MYESKHQPPLQSVQFAFRMLWHFAVSLALWALSLVMGIVGYMELERMSFLDALLNATMILVGMGPVNPPVTPGGKIFTTFYALYAGLVFVIAAALLFTPWLHRLLHRFHWEGK